MHTPIPDRANDLQLFGDDVRLGTPKNPVDVQPFGVDVHSRVPKTPSMFRICGSIFASESRGVDNVQDSGVDVGGDFGVRRRKTALALLRSAIWSVPPAQIEYCWAGGVKNAGRRTMFSEFIRDSARDGTPAGPDGPRGGGRNHGQAGDGQGQSEGPQSLIARSSARRRRRCRRIGRAGALADGGARAGWSTGRSGPSAPVRDA